MIYKDKIRNKKLLDAMLVGAQLLVDNGLGQWKIKLNNRRTVLAETSHSQKTISYSKHFIDIADRDQFEGITLHEVTHALLGPGHGHDREFVKLCTKLSPTPLYARHNADIPIRKYLLICSECGYTGTNNMMKERYCAKCWDNNKTVKFDIKENILKVKVW